MPQNNLNKRLTYKLKNEPCLSFIKTLFDTFPDLELYLVGGMVRDIILNVTNSKDFDFVARNVDVKDLTTELNKLGWCDLTGRDFGVIKFKPAESNQFIDIALPRTEQGKMTGGYRDFTLQVDKKLSLEKDLARRDLTINAMAWDIKNRTLIDPFKGQEDIEAKLIRSVGSPEKRFQEDYSRILRALRFACQFNLKIESKTWTALKKLVPHIVEKRQITQQEHIQRRLAQEIIEENREKYLTQLNSLTPEEKIALVEEDIVPSETLTRELFKALTVNPLGAVKLYDDCGALELLMPEIHDLKGCTQSAKFHSEGDVWTHTLMTLKQISEPEFAEHFPDFKITGVFVLACLLHDIGKPAMRTVDDSISPAKISFSGHAEEGVSIAKKICARLKLSHDSQEKISFMIKHHMLVMSSTAINKFRAHKLAECFIDNQHSLDLLALLYLDIMGALKADGTTDKELFDNTLQRIEEIKETRSHQPKKIIDGAKVIELLEIDAGPFVACILDLIDELKNQGKINRAGDAEKFLREHAVHLKNFAKEISGHNSAELAEKILNSLQL
ncbi:MAG: Polynucleotide adenylyltransferase region [Parcubacteria group bacterium GW2011_GWC2_39_14]|nr:MAG: Polynucleotide adenylyltransferase region [Parcubacteria group bacterium GW2011_GWC2_39_14]KKR54735.1 MAG: Polynucleotide adenylyltransferase region [Parcubacteria group bacterium GW2011_GWA2_40_23]